MAETASGQCSWIGCARAGRARILDRTLCLDHFLEFSSRRIQCIQQTFGRDSEERNVGPEVQKFLSQVISETTLQAAQTKLLAPLQRETLMTLSTTAAEIYKQIQRSPRLVRRVGCLVRTGIISTEISEKCYTVNISQRGACIEVRSPLKGGRTIEVERADNKRCSRAKVQWIREKEPNRHLVGLEIVSEEDFWGLGTHGKDKKFDTCGAKT